MRLVIDANIIFAALIKKGLTSELLTSNELQLFAPEFLLEEIKKYQNLIIEKMHRSPDDFEHYLRILSEYIIIIPKEEIMPFMESAEKISPDPKDSTYFALALAISSGIWSNDKKLKMDQDKINVFSTSDLLKKMKIIKRK